MVKSAVRSFLFAVSMLTRIPVPLRGRPTTPEIGRSATYFPIVGVFVGATLIGVWWASEYVWDTPLTGAALTLVAWIAITGGFHLEGLMDSCDGLLSGRPRDAMLRIMKDSRVGAFGAIGMGGLLLLKLAALAALSPAEAWKGLLVAPVLGRWAMTYAVARYPYAREEGGMGAAFVAHSKRAHLVVASVFALLIAGVALRADAIVVVPATAAATWMIASWIAKRLKGMTGDTYGALCELTETACLLVFAAR